MNHEKTSIYIFKCIVVIVGIASLITRCILKAEYIDIYMAVVNSISILISINIFLLDLYAKVREKYKVTKEKNNILRTSSIKNKAMIIYVMIFVLNVIVLILLAMFYFLRQKNIALCNDILGISSLIFAISYDAINDILVAFM